MEDYNEQDHENDLKRAWLSTYPDASVTYEAFVYEYEAKKAGKGQQSSAGGMHDCGDDELPF